MTDNPHAAQPVISRGPALAAAKSAMILIHGRGASAENIIFLRNDLNHPDMAYLAPQAAGNTWYPFSFLEDMARNQPGLDSGLAKIDTLVEQIADAGIPTERIIIGGFSQGACLALEYVARNAKRYGGVFAFSGGLIGPPGTPREYAGTLAGTPVFLGCSDVDFHIPKVRVVESAEVLERLGGAVEARLYAGMGHTIIQDELDAVNAIVQQVGGKG